MDNFQQIDPKYLALIQAGMGILAANNGRQPAGAAIGQGLLGGTNAYQENLMQQQEAALRQQEMDMRNQEFDWQKQKRDAEKAQNEQQKMLLGNIAKDYGLDPSVLSVYPGIGEDVVKNKLIPKPTKLNFAPNGIAYDENNPGLKVGENYSKQEPIDYNKPFLPDGTPNIAYQKFKMSDSKASAPVTTINNKLDLKTGEGLAKEVGPMVAVSKAAAEGANNTLDITKRIDTAINSGKLIAGPLAGGRVKLLQIGEVMGLNGADSSQTLANTRDTIQGLAKITLEGRSALKGQGQISDYEGKLLARASSGDISELTLPELRIISAAARRVAKAQQNIHSKNMKVMRSKPELSDVADFYDVQSNDAPEQPAAKAKTADELIKQRGW